MKNRYRISTALLLIALSLSVRAQVGVGTTTPDASAQLDITSDSKGVLIPRMTSSERSGISNAVEGLLVYQTTAPAGFYYYTGSQWVRLVNSTETVPAPIPSLYAGNSSGLLLPLLPSETSVPLPSDQVINYGTFSVSGDNTFFIVYESGRYQISYAIGLSGGIMPSSSGVEINGISPPSSILYPSPLVSGATLSTSFIVDMTAGSIVRLWLTGIGIISFPLDGSTYMSIVKLE